MTVGTEYTLTAKYDHAWVFNPTYSFEAIASKDVVTTSVQDNKLKIKFLKGGSCTIRITATDALGEKDANGNSYTFETEYHAYPEKPTFIPPPHVDQAEPVLHVQNDVRQSELPECHLPLHRQRDTVRQ